MRISDWSSDVCSSDLDIDVVLILARLGEQFDLRERRVGEARRHDERRVARRAAEVHEAALGEDDDLLAVGEFDQVGARLDLGPVVVGKRRSEEHTSEPQSLMRISYAVFCLKKKKKKHSRDKNKIENEKL